MRKLASIQMIDEIHPIPEADKIECAIIGGWQVVVGKDQFKPGDFCVYFEIDSILPIKPEYEFLRKSCYIKDPEGFRLKTVRLRGQISQGLAIPVSSTNLIKECFFDPNLHAHDIGYDVTERLGVVKYDPEIHSSLSASAIGNYPSFIPKTDQERVQNLTRYVHSWSNEKTTWEMTEKLDGTSMTIYHRDGHVGVCSRNLELRENLDHDMWKIANLIREPLVKLGNYAIQGELVGPSVQGNHYKLKHPTFFVYNVFDIDRYEFLIPTPRYHVCHALGLNHVPIVEYYFKMGGQTVNSLLELADGPSILNPDVPREGYVFKCYDIPGAQFKAISNIFLLS
jgi:RNA ligase (TIGR02306 family)